MLPTLEAEPVKQLSLTVRTSDSQSEIVVLDSRGRLVQRGFGPAATFLLDPGIYRVKVLTGSEFEEKSIVLTGAARELKFEACAFASPVPLAGTSTSHEYHMAAASRESKVTHVTDGPGSSLFFLVRDWTPAAETSRHRITGNPAEGLSLHAVGANGERKICDLATAGSHNAADDPWAACTIGVAPGVYELRLELPGGETLHQSCVASPGWQSQSFVFMRAYPSAGAVPQWRADLSRTSVLLSQLGGGFSPNESELRTAELARVALATTRPGRPGERDRALMPDQVRAMLRTKYGNPILGIYGAHLLLMEAPVDFDLVREVVGNLRGLLGSHPDVEALGLSVPGLPPPLPFEHPPMLRRSWSLVVDASVTRPWLVTESLAARNTQEVSEGPWQIWRSLPEGGDPNALELSAIEVALAEDLGVMKHVRTSQARSSMLPEGTFQDWTAPEGLSPREAFGDDLAMGARGVGDVPEIVVPQRLRNLSPDVEVDVDTDKMRSIVKRFGMPSAQVKRMLATLEDKLARRSDTPNLKVVLK